MSELKACPFCGGEAETIRNDIGVFIGCFNDDCPIGPATSTYVDGYATEAEAIAAWNARAERTCRVESVSLIDWWEYTPANYYEFEMECGGGFRWDWREPPDYCPNCGARVIGGNE